MYFQFTAYSLLFFSLLKSFKVKKKKGKTASPGERQEVQCTWLRKITCFPVAEKYLIRLDYFSFSSKFTQMLLTISLLY